jgi:uncharacterized protein YjbI with pentapeptide repeats
MVIAGAGAAFILLWWLVPPLLYAGASTGDVRVKAITDTRTALLAGLVGLGALGTFWLNSRVYRITAQTFAVTERGQVTDRYSTAIQQLGSDSLDVRLGGIYALEQIAKDSARAEDDQATIVEVLSAFVRVHSVPTYQYKAAYPDKSAEMTEEDLSSAARDYLRKSTKPPVDIQAAVTVLGRLRPLQGVPRADLTHATLERVDLHTNLTGAALSSADLARANLHSAGLTGADLFGADLTWANLKEADLTGADLSQAKLDHADLTGANLTGAKLNFVNLHKANLTGANLTGAKLNLAAKLSEAKLKGADLTGANLTGADLFRADLFRANLKEANLTEANLYLADLISADLTGANLFRANLTGVRFIATGDPWSRGAFDQTIVMPHEAVRGLTQTQLDQTRGDHMIKLPAGLHYPERWPVEAPESDRSP